ncbi:hypothetical protein OF820_10505 [Oceanotoga sp. DSM 15011]|jgi:hypothetical protein|uniref:Uncharacterized protein n=1 Tax=Oceanotoga teriensis TaxID=515440 RepID=A0AA45HJA8_9BACT|nr:MULTISPECIES: hypothetical protein [Oceanotoga]MDN5342530.1 hypothetical protein [Oceanotoga sp.]MDO7977459.1 hypothetical protein [Oceanotoga teriensis]PWJ95665.1 hypothetical protein C7380_10479 [Oceanotoga teriensis]UYO99499.1 hypothetical protein OF820_10505 [Oceanotoga sp. DSM 15011]
MSGLSDYPFDYKIGKDNKLFISYYGKQVKIIKDKKAKTLIEKLEDCGYEEQQLILAKLTGNFKRGNERNKKWKYENKKEESDY